MSDEPLFLPSPTTQTRDPCPGCKQIITKTARPELILLAKKQRPYSRRGSMTETNE